MSQVMTIPVTIDLPGTLVQQLEHTAQQQHRSVSEIVREFLLQKWPLLPRLPEDVEAELAAFTSLSDEVLWLLARGTLSQPEQEELSVLNHSAQQRTLRKSEQARQQGLVDAYERMMIRRAHAALLLKGRGYNLSDPSVLRKA
jgi:alpha-amylase/alpha-mannosidase (GH57 family)